jgi:hypothetical protein
MIPLLSWDLLQIGAGSRRQHASSWRACLSRTCSNLSSVCGFELLREIQTLVMAMSAFFSRTDGTRPHHADFSCIPAEAIHPRRIYRLLLLAFAQLRLLLDELFLRGGHLFLFRPPRFFVFRIRGWLGSQKFLQYAGVGLAYNTLK